MRLFFLAILLLYSSAQAKDYTFKVTKVYDGDTLFIENLSNIGGNELYPSDIEKLKLSIRILGIDTPEKGLRAKCKEENDLSEKATSFVEELIKDNDNTISANSLKWDKYGGRINANVKVGDKDLAQLLIDAGYAKPYFGGKKDSWCNN